MDIPKIVEEVLPKGIVTSLSSAIAITAIAYEIRRAVKDGAGALLAKERVWRLRVFAIALFALLGITAVVPVEPAPEPNKPAAAPVQAKSVSARLLPAEVAAAAYVACELGLLAWLLTFRRRRVLLEDDYLRTCVDILKNRQTAEGAFRVKAGPDARAELWTTAQALQGLVTSINRADIAPVTNRVVGYYETELPKPHTLWNSKGAVFVASSAWSLLSLAELAKSAYWANLTPSHQGKVRTWIRDGVTTLATLQTTEGAWTPLGSDLHQDSRTFPTVVALWAISMALEARVPADLTDATATTAASAIDRGCKFLRDTSVAVNDERWWDPNPKREWRQKSIGLTLLCYGVLLRVANGPNARAVLGASIGELVEWLKGQHDPVMRLVDYGVHRDLEDNEADGPWDQLVRNRDGAASEVPITYFDWATSALFALRMCKVSKSYDYSDAARERTLTTMLTSRPTLDPRYSFQLAMVLIAAGTDGPIASL